MEILVRWATRWDRKVLTEMICELARQHGHLTSTDTVSSAFDYALNHPERIRIAVAQNEGKELLGTASLHEAYSTWDASLYGTIEDVFTLPEHRGKGVATALLNLLNEESQRRGYCRVELQVQEDNDKAWKFYEGRGMSFSGYIVYEKSLREDTSTDERGE
ncbi:MAG: GNAT family N-acetyltransferase [Armatimonadota bacterium]